MSQDIVPFGKYKNQPLDILIQDQGYCEWLQTQAWFSSKFPALHTLIINNFGEPAETPEHNQMQLKFLDAALRLKLTKDVFDFFRVTTTNPPCHFFGLPSAPEFEIGGADILYTVAIYEYCLHKGQGEYRTVLGKQYDEDKRNTSSKLYSDYHIKESEAIKEINMIISEIERKQQKMQYDYSLDRTTREREGKALGKTLQEKMHMKYKIQHTIWDERREKEEAFETQYLEAKEFLNGKYSYEVSDYQETSYPFLIRIECKPTLGDEYPAVLRQIRGSRKIDLKRPCRAIFDVLCIQACTFRDVSFAEVQQFFQLSNVYLCMMAEIGQSQGEHYYFASAPEHFPNPFDYTISQNVTNVHNGYREGASDVHY